MKTISTTGLGTKNRLFKVCPDPGLLYIILDFWGGGILQGYLPILSVPEK
jgi:hypothetical protein